MLDYVNHRETGLKVIAIGGDKLSRGLTLEGLTVSYFLRASRMYDTLMQMGRWFGYRPRYLDLCRLYTTPEMVNWFRHIAEADEELREDFERMAMSGGTPKEFGLRLRSHPVLMVTSQVKMRHGTTIDVSFSGDICETVNFWRDRLHLRSNWEATQRLLMTAEENDGGPTPLRAKEGEVHQGPWVWRCGHQPIVEFLEEYTEHPASVRVKTQPLADYIRQEALAGRLIDWTILLASGDGVSSFNVCGVSFRPVIRRWHLNNKDDEAEKAIYQRENHFRIRRVVNPTDEHVDLTQSQYESAFEMTIQRWREIQKGNEPKRPSGPSIRSLRPATAGLLILYPIDATDGSGPAETGRVEGDAADLPIVGFALSFPQVNGGTASRVSYVVNSVYSKQEWENDDYYSAKEVRDR